MTIYFDYHKRLDYSYIVLDDVKSIKDFSSGKEYVLIPKSEYEGLRADSIKLLKIEYVQKMHILKTKRNKE